MSQSTTTAVRRVRYVPFSPVMARAVRDGLKTQTRRVVRWDRRENCCENDPVESVAAYADVVVGYADNISGDPVPIAEATCPYGEPGDELVLLTHWATEKRYDGLKPSDLPKRAKIWTCFDSQHSASGRKPDWCGRLRMARFMPAWVRAKMPRATVVDVRVERIEAISEADAIAEGMVKFTKDHRVFKFAPGWRYRGEMEAAEGWAWREMPTTAREALLRLFYDLNERAEKGTNPWVWVVEFKVIDMGLR